MGRVHDEQYRVRLQRRVSELGLENAVELLERRPQSELPQVYSAHDVLAFTTEGPEPFASTLIEAMASGIPIVSSLTGGSAEIVRDGENACAFRAGDPANLAEKIAWMLKHPIEAAKMGQVASADVLANHTLDTQATKIEAFIKARIVPNGSFPNHIDTMNQ